MAKRGRKSKKFQRQNDLTTLENLVTYLNPSRKEEKEDLLILEGCCCCPSITLFIDQYAVDLAGCVFERVEIDTKSNVIKIWILPNGRRLRKPEEMGTDEDVEAYEKDKIRPGTEDYIFDSPNYTINGLLQQVPKL